MVLNQVHAKPIKNCAFCEFHNHKSIFQFVAITTLAPNIFSMKDKSIKIGSAS